MIRLSEMLAARGFVPDPNRVKLVRHKDSRLDREALRNPGWPDVYQRYQSASVFDGCSQIVVFLGPQSGHLPDQPWRFRQRPRNPQMSVLQIRL